jgi:hypothetical protein
MLKKLIWLIPICLLYAGPSPAQEAVVDFEGRYWVTDLSAVTKVQKSGRGTDVDFKSDLKLSDKNFPEGRMTVFVNPDNRLTLSYTPVDYSTDTRINRTVEFGGQTYSVNSRVIGDLKMQYLKLGWTWQFINLERGMFKLGTLVEGKGFWGDVTLAAPEQSPPIKETRSFFAVLPALGLALDVNPVPFLNFYGEFSGMTALQYGYLWEGEAGVRFIPFRNFTISGGYRIFNVEARDDPDFARIRLSGPFV